MCVIAHQVSFFTASRHECCPFAGIMDPWASGSRPLAAVFFDSIIDGEDFEEIFESTAAS